MNNYLNLEVFKLSKNLIEAYPFLTGKANSKIAEIFLNENNISAIHTFSSFMTNLIVLNFDKNRIAFIEYDAFFYCRSLENLSMSDNLLTNLTENALYYLFSLKYLNLSHNLLESIGMNSFQNLNKLESLDLNFNRLFLFKDYLFLSLIHI